MIEWKTFKPWQKLVLLVAYAWLGYKIVTLIKVVIKFFK